MTVVADPPPAFLGDLTPASGLALRRWTPDEYRRLEAPFGASETGKPRLFNREEYYRSADQGILGPEERTELIYGRIIGRMSPMGRTHGIAVSKAASALTAVFGIGYAVEQQVPIRLGSGLESEPDVTVLPGMFDDYRDAPLPSDLLLVVEISDSALRYDRGTKAALYAAGNIPDYWLVNLKARTLEVRRRPEGGAYLSLGVFGGGESVAPLAALSAPVRVADLLPLI